MEKLLRLAVQSADQAEVYHTESNWDSIDFNDGKLEKADSSLSSGIALRIIKDGKMGLAHTRNLLNPEALIKQALQSAANGVAVDFQMPFTPSVPHVDAFSSGIDVLSKQELIAKANDILAYIKKRVDTQVNLGISYGASAMGIMNSAGTNLTHKGSAYGINVQLIFPGTGSGLLEYKVDKGYVDLKETDLDKMIELYMLSKKQIVPPTKKLPVIFTPLTLFALLSRFAAATAPVNIHNQISPLCGKLGEKIFSDKLSIWQDPFDTEMSDSTGFDSEGTPTQKMSFVDKGVFKALALDLNYAQKLKMAPTGNGFRQALEGLPMAQPINVCLATGQSSLEAMISGIKEGIIVHSLMGAHSGNVLNGDYSVGVSAGFMIQNGKITGRVKDCLLSGNAYETLSDIAEIEDKCLNLGSHKIPSILCENVSVAGK
jgi:PmbA protein